MHSRAPLKIHHAFEKRHYHAELQAHLTLFLQSTTGGTVMPTTARVLPGLNMLHCAHAPASSLHFVDGQELLSALLNSSPLFHLASRLHGLTSYFTGCPCVLRVLFLGVCLFWVGVLVVGSLPVGCNLACNSILTRLR